jgi:hypothetical protein
MAGEFTLTKLDVIVPKNLEVIWGIVRPIQSTVDFKGIIVCSFYSVPYSKKKAQLVQHIAINYAELKSKYKNCFFLAGGDKNDLEIRNILDISPTFHMHNTKATHGDKNIDVLVSDMVHLFSESIIIPNVKTDIPDGQPGGGKQSDHPIVYCEPRLEMTDKPARRVETKKTRRMDDNKKRLLAQWIQHESWEMVFNSKSASQMAVKFTEVVNENIDKFCPEEEVKITQFDGRVTSLALQKLTRQKKREYNRHGNSRKFKELKKKLDQRIKLEGKKALDKILDNGNSKGMKWVREANRVSARPGEDTSGNISLPTHIDANLTPQESAEAIVTYFSKISQEFTPIEEDSSAKWLDAERYINSEPCQHPAIYEHEVFENMKRAKKTDSVPGDVPASILQEFLPEFASPITAILREAVQSHEWPEIYKKEFHLPLKKIPCPQTEDDLRGIGLTSWVSKQLERLVLNWIWPYVRPHLDPDQMGGRAGCSIEHYIIKMVQFILSSMNGNTNAAVVAVPVDYSKAFNRMQHSDILINLTALNVPTCAVKLIKSYLTQRSMCVRFRGAVSSFQKCPGGGPQGGLLTSLLFCLQVNKAGSPCMAPMTPALRQASAPHPAITSPSHPSLRQIAVQGPAIRPDNYENPPCADRRNLHKKSYIDDLTLLEKILLSNLIEKEKIIGPLNWHDRFNLTLPSDKFTLQHQLADLEKFTNDHFMKLNSKKTKCIPFISSRTKDFMPQLSLNDGEQLEVIYKLKLVGIVISSELSWNDHIDYTVSRVNGVLWQLLRFKI